MLWKSIAMNQYYKLPLSMVHLLIIFNEDFVKTLKIMILKWGKL